MTTTAARAAVPGGQRRPVRSGPWAQPPGASLSAEAAALTDQLDAPLKVDAGS